MSSQSESLVVLKPTQVQFDKCSEFCSDLCIKECVVKEYYVKWTLDRNVDNDIIKSCPFHIGKLLACLNYRRLSMSAKHWSLYLQLSGYTTFPRGKFVVKYVDYDNIEKEHEIMIGVETFRQERGWGFPVNVWFNEDRIAAVFKCTIWDVEVDESLISSRSRMLSPQPLSTFYLKLLTDGQFSDVTLKVGGKAIKAHKCILASRSPVFAAMLKADMAESRSNEIVIEDIEVAVMKMLLRFIYSGCLEANSELNKDLMLELLRAADKYDIPDLTAACTTALVKLVNIENVIELRTKAVLYRVDKLVKEADRFVSKNMLAVSKTEGWKKLKKSDPNLALDIIECFMFEMN